MKKRLFACFLGLCLLAACPALAQQNTPAPAVESAPMPATDAPAPAPVSAAPSALQAPAPHASELWSGSLYTSTYRAGVCIDPRGSVRGVLLLRTMAGQTDTYHFYGTLENGTIRASHGSGHHFKGSFPAADEVEGTITLKNGRSFNLIGKREQHVVLTESCRPLPN